MRELFADSLENFGATNSPVVWKKLTGIAAEGIGDAYEKMESYPLPTRLEIRHGGPRETYALGKHHLAYSSTNPHITDFTTDRPIEVIYLAIRAARYHLIPIATISGHSTTTRLSWKPLSIFRDTGVDSTRLPPLLLLPSLSGG
jgi:hypothetical protein